MEDHNIDWFFSYEGLPCYSPSNGFILPNVIKVRKNRELQVALYNDIIENCEPFIDPNNPATTYKRIESALFYRNSNFLQSLGIEIINESSYLFLEEFVFVNSAIDHILRSEFSIENPTEENRRSFYYAYIEVARRGFACLYPYTGGNDSEQVNYMIIGFPNPSLPKEKRDKTFAAQIRDSLPRYDDARLVYERNQELLFQVTIEQVFALFALSTR